MIMSLSLLPGLALDGEQGGRRGDDGGCDFNSDDDECG